MNAKSVRIKDIAQLAGVSVGTVDRVLHNRGRVSADALKKVEAVLEQIDYKPNLIARTLGANKAYKIAALMPDPSLDGYWESSRSGLGLAEAEWLRYGVRVETHFFNLNETASFQAAADKVIRGEPDGILVAPVFFHESMPFFKQLDELGIPYVLFNTNINAVNALSFIGQNLYQSGVVGAELLKLLMQCDAGKIIVLHINEDVDNSLHLVEKERGFREYFASGKFEKFQIETLNLNNPNDIAFEHELVSQLRAPDVKGVFVSTSKGTSLVADVIYKNTIDVRVVGYDMLKDNIHFMQQGVIDFLINQNPKRQTLLGVSHLVSQLILKKQPPQQDLLPLEIISQTNLESYLRSEHH